MPIDVRAKVFCNLGPLISGNISDEPLTVGQGLIRCRGQIVLKGLFTPSVGSVVTLGYEQNGTVARIPRVLRVLGSFADPFRNTTTVSIGDKLVWLADSNQAIKDIYPDNDPTAIKPDKPSFPETADFGDPFVADQPYPDAEQNEATPLAKLPQIKFEYTGACWREVELPETTPPEDPNAPVKSQLKKDFPLSSGFDFSNARAAQQVTVAEEYSNAPLKELLTVKPSISASFIGLKCLAALGIGSRGLGLFNSYPQGEFDLTEGYVSVLDKLLSSEGRVGYLDETEMLVTVAVCAPPAQGVLLTEDDIIDVGQLNIGTPPSRRIIVATRAEKNKEEPQPPENIAPVANDVRVGIRYPNTSSFTVSGSMLAQRGFDPDYAAQAAVGAAQFLKIASVSSGTGCSASLTSAVTGVITVTPQNGFTGVGSFSFTLTDGVSTSNSSTCYFQIYDPQAPENQNDPLAAATDSAVNLQERINEAADEITAAPNPTTDSESPDANADEGAQKDQAAAQPESKKRNWEFEESQGEYKPVLVPWINADGEKKLARFGYTPYTNSYSEYDEYDRLVKRTTRRDGIVADAAGNIVKSTLEAAGKENGADKLSWYTIETYEYYTKYDENEKYTTEQSEYGQAYEDFKQREDAAWQEAMAANDAANTAVPMQCPLDFNPPTQPLPGDQYDYDGKNFEFDGSGWKHQPQNNVPIASSYPSAIYSSDLQRTLVKRRQVLYSWMLSQESRTYTPLAEVMGSVYLPMDEEFYYFARTDQILSDKTVIEYDVDYGAGKAKTTTHRWTLGANTAEGQQLIASIAEGLDSYGTVEERRAAFAEMLDIATTLSYQGAEIHIRTDREYGIQQRPSLFDREWTDTYENEQADPEVFGDFQVVDINSKRPNKVIELEQDQPTDPSNEPDPTSGDSEFPRNSQAQERFPELKVQMPYIAGPKRKLNADLQAEYENSNAEEQALAYGRATNAIARGNRYGMGLQFGPNTMPRKALDWLYVQIGGVGAAYRTNGTSWVFNESGLLCNTDALFWGGVGGEGGVWYPLAQGITTLPALPTVTTAIPEPANAMPTPEGFNPAAPGTIWTTLPYLQEPVYAKSIEPEFLVPSYAESIRTMARVRLRLSAERLNYSLTVAPQTVVLAVTVGMSAARVKILGASNANFGVSGKASSLTHTRRVQAAAGSFVRTGYSAGSVRSYGIGTNAGTFALSGQDAAVKRLFAPLTAETGSFTLTGQNATSSGATTLTAAVGTYNFTGQEAGKLQFAVLPADTGSLVLGGQPASLSPVTSQVVITAYTGNGTANNAVTGLGFEPSFVHVKRYDTASAHAVFTKNTSPYSDAAHYRHPLNGQNADTTSTSPYFVTFDSDGFTLKDTAYNVSSGTYRAFCFKKGSGPTTNTDGSITTQVDVNETLGMSQFTFTPSANNATIGHGLGAAPELVIMRQFSGGAYFQVGGTLIGNNYLMALNTNTVRSLVSTGYQAFSSTTISIGNNAQINSGSRAIGWAFISKPNYSKLGTYVGSTSTVSVNVGFQPRIVLTKAVIGSNSNWAWYFSPTGSTGNPLFFNLNDTAVGGTSSTFSFTSSGFTATPGGAANVNASTTYLYMAFK